MSFIYTKAELTEGLKKCGIAKGDTIFCHSNIGFFGFLEGAETADDICKGILEAIFDAIGDTGTLVVPTFTYSFGSNKEKKVFDVQNSPAESMGIFSEFVQKLPDSFRSTDPMFSVSAVGDKARILTENVSDECFGKDSFWDRFVAFDGKICNLNFDSGSTLIHFFEKRLSVPYRKDIEFNGTVVENGRSSKKTITFFCRDLNDPESVSKFERFDKYAKQKYSKTATVGRGIIVVITAEQTSKLINEIISFEPFFLTKRGEGESR